MVTEKKIIALKTPPTVKFIEIGVFAPVLIKIISSFRTSVLKQLLHSTSPSQTVGCFTFNFVLSQTSLTLIKFIEKY